MCMGHPPSRSSAPRSVRPCPAPRGSAGARPGVQAVERRGERSGRLRPLDSERPPSMHGVRRAGRGPGGGTWAVTRIVSPGPPRIRRPSALGGRGRPRRGLGIGEPLAAAVRAGPARPAPATRSAGGGAGCGRRSVAASSIGSGRLSAPTWGSSPSRPLRGERRLIRLRRRLRTAAGTAPRTRAPPRAGSSCPSRSPSSGSGPGRSSA